VPRTPTRPPPANEPVLEQIRELEAQLDKLIDEASRKDLSSLVADEEADLAVEESAPPPAVSSTPVLEAEIASEPELPPPPISLPRPSVAALREADPTVFDTARELLSTDFYLRKWGRVGMRRRSEEVDDFGFDPIYDQKLRPVLEFLYSRYFRVATTGIDRVPSRGRCLLVANHSGTLPLDGVMIKTAVKLEHPTPRDVRWLTEDFITHMPWLGSTMNRLGAVRAHQENAERLLAKEQLVAVFPEGVKGIGKLFGERYRLQRFGRGGFIKLALRTGTPVVPVAVVGAEEIYPLVGRAESVGKLLGMPYVPITPFFPVLGILGALPLPTKWYIRFGKPIRLNAMDDEARYVRARLEAMRVRRRLQAMVTRLKQRRKSLFFG
jgi:1-acyl-sn-glycerol-3-phosphate acyltransferase